MCSHKKASHPKCQVVKAAMFDGNQNVLNATQSYTPTPSWVFPLSSKLKTCIFGVKLYHYIIYKSHVLSFIILSGTLCYCNNLITLFPAFEHCITWNDLHVWVYSPCYWCPLPIRRTHSVFRGTCYLNL
jgi:hypothetical protein